MSDDRSAVHRGLVRAGRWSPDVGEAFSRLVGFRMTADDGGLTRVTQEDAPRAVADAEMVLEAVRRAAPGTLA